MAWVKSGTITLTSASDAVVGVGTNWFSELQVGHALVAPSGAIYEIVTIDDATNMTISPAYVGVTVAGVNYAVMPTRALADALAANVRELIDDFQSVVDQSGEGKFDNGTLSEPGVRFTSDEDTGVRRVSTNRLALVAGGVDQISLVGGVATGAAVQSNLKDVTVGKLMKVGAFGWGLDDDAMDTTTGDDLDALTIQGVWRYSSGTTGAPSTAGNVIHLTRLSGAFMQIAVSNTGLVYIRSFTSSTWSDWSEIARQGDSVSFAGITGTGVLTLGGNPIGGEQQTIADDAVGSFTPPRPGGWMRLLTAGGAGDTPVASASVDAYFDTGSSLFIEKNTGWATIGSTVDVVLTDVTGTDGTDGNITVAVQSGVVKIENRSGGSRDFSVTWM